MVQKMKLGHTGMEVTQLGFGAMEIGNLAQDGGRLSGDEHAGKVLNAVLDSGVNFVDTPEVDALIHAAPHGQAAHCHAEPAAAAKHLGRGAHLS